MTCNEACELMLEAELEELQGYGAGVLAQHVRECDRCRAVARRIVKDSRLLAVAVRRASPIDLASFAARTRVSRRTLVGGAVAAIAASVVLAVLVQNGMKGYAQADKSFVAVTTTPVLPPGAGPERPGVGELPGDVSASVQVQPDGPAVQAVRLADVEPVHAAAYIPPAEVVPAVTANEQAVVSVTPPRGRRAAIMKGRRNVTVVWLY